MRIDKQQRLIITKLCKKYNLTEAQVLELIKSPFVFIRDKTAELKLPDNLKEEEFNKLSHNFNIPSIGKLYCNYYAYKKVNNAKQNRKNSKEKRVSKGNGSNSV